MGARCVRILVRLFANALGMIAILALADKDFDATELTAFFAFCVWLVLVEGAVALAKVEPIGHERGYAHAALLPVMFLVGVASMTLSTPQPPPELISKLVEHGMTKALGKLGVQA